MIWLDYVFGAFLIAVAGFGTVAIVVVSICEGENDGEDS